MKNVSIKEIKFLSREAEEAIVTITDGVYQCLTFCHPCNKYLGEIITEPIFAFNSHNIFLDMTGDKVYFKYIENKFSHEIIAKVLKSKENIVQVGYILIELDADLPGGIEIGDYIRFNCGRLDLF